MKLLKNVLSVLFRIAISILLLVFLLRQVDVGFILETVKNSQKVLLVLAFIVYLGNCILALLRWKMLLDAAKIHLPLKRVIISFAGGTFFNLFLPSTVGGDFIRSIDLAAHTKRPREVVATVLLDRLSGYVGLVVLAILAIALGWRYGQDPSVLLSVGIITAILLAILLVLFNKAIYSKVNRLLHSSRQIERRENLSTLGKFREALKNLHQELHIFRHHKRVAAQNLLLSFVIQITTPISFYFIALSLGLQTNIIYFFVFMPVIGAISLLPISIGGLGLRDATTVYFFARVGANKDLTLAMSLLSFLFILIIGGIGGLIYALTVHHRRVQHYQ